MDSQTPSRSSQARTYLLEMFDLNPIWQSGQIIRRRDELWGITASNALAVATDRHDEEATRLRDKAMKCLQKLQAEFYQLPNEKLDHYLKFLEQKKLPEFAGRASRLRAIATERQTLLDATQAISDQKFKYSLLQGLVASTAESGALKEQYIEAIIAEKRVGRACKAVAQFAKQYPSIRNLELNWFNLFLDPKNVRRWSEQQGVQFAVGQSSYRLSSMVYTFVAIVVVVILCVVLADQAMPPGSVGNQSSTTRRAAPPNHLHRKMMQTIRSNAAPKTASQTPAKASPPSVQPPSTAARQPAFPPSTTRRPFEPPTFQNGMESFAVPRPSGAQKTKPSARPDYRDFLREQEESLDRFMKETINDTNRFMEEHRKEMDAMRAGQFPTGRPERYTPPPIGKTPRFPTQPHPRFGVPPLGKGIFDNAPLGQEN